MSQLVLFRCHFNPLPPHGGRRNLIMKKIDVIFISIHSLRMEGDIVICTAVQLLIISIHSLRMEGDAHEISGILTAGAFQSTPSAWRETFSHSISGATPVFQSTPSAWRETVCHSRSPPDWNYFNPLPPHGGRPEREISISVFVSISIHSLRMEGDVGQSTPIQGLRDFNPLPPHGGRPVS